jgi:hypothetical protein
MRSFPETSHRRSLKPLLEAVNGRASSRKDAITVAASHVIGVSTRARAVHELVDRRLGVRNERAQQR